MSTPSHITPSRLWPLLTGLLSASLCYGLTTVAFAQSEAIGIVVAVTVLCALWWALEPIPIPVTALIPLAIFPLTGVLSREQVAAALGHQVNLLLLGGFVLSLAMERSEAHARLADRLLRAIAGGAETISARRVIAAFMVVAAAISMWISNAAATIMLLPVALAIVKSVAGPEQVHGGKAIADSRLLIPLLLGICYAASIGGLGTPIGTPANLVFISVYEAEFGIEVSFIRWMSWALPVVALMLPLAIIWMSRHVDRGIRLRLAPPQPMNSWQKRILWVFLITAGLWITRTEPFGGWRAWLELPEASDASVALLAVIALCLLPRGGKPEEHAGLENGGDNRGEISRKPLFLWEYARDLPWGILLLFSGGIALAIAFKASGLSALIASGFAGVGQLPIWLIILSIALLVTFLTEVSSNTATTSLLMPVLASVAIASGVDGLVLMLPAALSASFAFMMPVATAPNAVIFGSGKVPIKAMIRYGLILNFIGAAVIFAYSSLVLS